MLRKVVFKVSDIKVKMIKQELQSLMKLESGISINQIRFGSLGDEVIMSFNIDGDHYQMIFEKMRQLGANPLIPVVKKVSDKIISKETGTQTAGTVPYTNKPIVNNNKNSSINLETAIKNGDYETLIKVSKDIRNTPELIKKAKDNIYNTLMKEIEKVYEQGNRSNIYRKDSIERLIKISADKDIKAMYKIDALKYAGLTAVKLCALSMDYTNYLIQLCNNNSVPHIVNIKAAIALSVLLFSDEVQSTEELDYVVKHLNIKWLLIAYDVVIGELSTEERDKFIQLISAVKEKR